MNIYPAIDMIGGQAVRLRQGDAADKTVYGAPLEMAHGFEAAGARWLHMVDLDAAMGKGSNRAIALQVARETGLSIELGGGIRDMAAIDELMQGGITRAIIGTAAVTQPELVSAALQKYGAERIAVGIDAREGVVAIRGWAQGSGVDAVELAARMRDMGVKYVVYTDIARDGMLGGLNLDATARIVAVDGLCVIASGGVRDVDDIRAARDLGCEGVITGKALYEGRLSLSDALSYQT